MKILITSACLYAGGTHADEGEVLDLPADQAAALLEAGRGIPAPAEPAKPSSPTFEEYVAAGYLPENYPPQGFEEVSSPGLIAYREEIAAKADADAKAKAEAKAASKAEAKAKADAEAKAKADAKP